MTGRQYHRLLTLSIASILLSAWLSPYPYGTKCSSRANGHLVARREGLRREFLGAGLFTVLSRDRLTKLFHLASPNIIVPMVGSKDMSQLMQHSSARVALRRSQPLGASEAYPTKMLPLTLRSVHVMSMGSGAEA